MPDGIATQQRKDSIMVQIGDIARVTAKDLGHNAEDVEPHVLLWQALLTIAERTTDGNPVRDSNQRLGFIVTVSAWKVVESLYPACPPDFVKETLDKARQAGLVKMRSKRPGLSPTWWVSCMQGEQPKERTQQERKEAKVTPHEAGEDRAPEPVTVTKAPPPLPTPQSIEAMLAGARARDERLREERNQEMLDALIKVNRPITRTQLRRLVKRGEGSVREGVRALVDAGLVVEAGGKGRGGGSYVAAVGSETNPPTRVKGPVRPITGQRPVKKAAPKTEPGPRRPVRPLASVPLSDPAPTVEDVPPIRPGESLTDYAARLARVAAARDTLQADLL